MAIMEFLKKHRDYILLAILIAAITGGNYVLSGGAKSNWVEVSDYGFTMLHPVGVNIWTTGLDEDNVFDPYGNIHATRNKGRWINRLQGDTRGKNLRQAGQGDWDRGAST